MQYLKIVYLNPKSESLLTIFGKSVLIAIPDTKYRK